MIVLLNKFFVVDVYIIVIIYEYVYDIIVIGVSSFIYIGFVCILDFDLELLESLFNNGSILLVVEVFIILDELMRCYKRFLYLDEDYVKCIRVY